MELQALWLALADWEEEDFEFGLPRLAQQLKEPLPFDWKKGLRLVWLEGRRHFLAFSAQKKSQPQLG